MTPVQAKLHSALKQWQDASCTLPEIAAGLVKLGEDPDFIEGQNIWEILVSLLLDLLDGSTVVGYYGLEAKLATFLLHVSASEPNTAISQALALHERECPDAGGLQILGVFSGRPFISLDPGKAITEPPDFERVQQLEVSDALWAYFESILKADASANLGGAKQVFLRTTVTELREAVSNYWNGYDALESELHLLMTSTPHATPLSVITHQHRQRRGAAACSQAVSQKAVT